MNELTQIKLHGCLGEQFGQDWSLCIRSVSEALRAINANCNGLFFKALIDNDSKGVKYAIVINDENFHCEKYKASQNINDLKDSSLFINQNIRKLEIVPHIQGAFSVLAVLFTGAATMAIGYSVGSTMMMVAGAALLFQGVSSLLSSPPKSEPFREMQGGMTSNSYLFNGPQNTVNEGNAVPLGYGRLIIGSQLISYSPKVSNKLLL